MGHVLHVKANNKVHDLASPVAWCPILNIHSCTIRDTSALTRCKNLELHLWKPFNKPHHIQGLHMEWDCLSYLVLQIHPNLYCGGTLNIHSVICISSSAMTYKIVISSFNHKSFPSDLINTLLDVKHCASLPHQAESLSSVHARKYPDTMLPSYSLQHCQYLHT